MKKLLFIIFSGICIFIAENGFSQTVYAYRVTFKNKNGGKTFADSLSFLSQKAMDRIAGLKGNFTNLRLQNSFYQKNE
jgi:hypothetical protein